MDMTDDQLGYLVIWCAFNLGVLFGLWFGYWWGWSRGRKKGKDL